MIAALSEYATTVPWGETACVWRIMANNDCGWRAPSMIHSPLKILWRQCSELACANMVSSASLGSRPMAW
jgi:hypothetical protein